MQNFIMFKMKKIVPQRFKKQYLWRKFMSSSKHKVMLKPEPSEDV